MDKLKPCPFCGSTNITMGAYSIAPECHIECECGAGIELIVNFDAEMSVEEHDDLCAMELTKAWNQRAQQQSNKPLTQEELRKMDGEPVWCVDGIGNVAWCLVSVWSNREEKAQGADCVDKNDGLWDATYYGMKGNGEHGLHAVGWLAYRRKPEVQDGT